MMQFMKKYWKKLVVGVAIPLTIVGIIASVAFIPSELLIIGALFTALNIPILLALTFTVYKTMGLDAMWGALLAMTICSVPPLNLLYIAPALVYGETLFTLMCALSCVTLIAAAVGGVVYNLDTIMEGVFGKANQEEPNHPISANVSTQADFVLEDSENLREESSVFSSPLKTPSTKKPASNDITGGSNYSPLSI